MKTVTIHGVNCKPSLIDKTFGMILLKNSEGIRFKTRFGIHTFFLRNPIDILILNRSKVARLKEKLKPNSVFFWNPKFSTIVELPVGSIKKMEINIGDKIILPASPTPATKSSS